METIIITQQHNIFLIGGLKKGENKNTIALNTNYSVRFDYEYQNLDKRLFCNEKA